MPIDVNTLQDIRDHLKAAAAHYRGQSLAARGPHNLPMTSIKALREISIEYHRRYKQIRPLITELDIEIYRRRKIIAKRKGG